MLSMYSSESRIPYKPLLTKSKPNWTSYSEPAGGLGIDNDDAIAACRMKSLGKGSSPSNATKLVKPLAVTSKYWFLFLREPKTLYCKGF
jgi:hypothetical protein